MASGFKNLCKLSGGPVLHEAPLYWSPHVRGYTLSAERRDFDFRVNTVTVSIVLKFIVLKAMVSGGPRPPKVVRQKVW